MVVGKHFPSFLLILLQCLKSKPTKMLLKKKTPQTQGEPSQQDILPIEPCEMGSLSTWPATPPSLARQAFQEEARIAGEAVDEAALKEDSQNGSNLRQCSSPHFGQGSLGLLGPPLPFYPCLVGRVKNRLLRKSWYPYSSLSTGGPRLLHSPQKKYT